MCNNGRRITKFVILVAALFSVLFVFFSCSNLFDDIKAPLTDGETVTISGAVANPQGEVGSKRAGRMALPSGAFAATEYTVTATAPGVSNRVSGSVNSNNNTFSIALALGKQWTITISMKVKETETDTEFKQVLQGSYAYDHALTVADVTVPISIVLAPISGGNGTIKLPMSVASGVSAETVVISGLSDDPETYTLSDGAYTINKLGVPSGAYTVTIDFKNTAGLVIYSTTQTINVISNMTTRRWVSDGSSSPINGDGTFVVTESLVQAFATSQIYVGANPYQMHEPSDTNLGTPYEPLATVGEAIRRLTDSSKDYTIRISGTQVGPITLGVSDDAPNFAARSVTLCGMTENMTDILTVSGVATILTITTTAPVTIRRLKITSGYNTSENSAGINMEAGSKLILEDGALITMNSGYMRGAGIYATGENTEIVMNSGSKVSGNELRYTSEGSYDFGGAGIYISGSGITDTSKLPKLTINTGAEISDNTATAFCRGGGIYAENAIVSINGGKITGNKAGDCAGNIYVVGSNSSLTMTAGEISDGEVNSVESYGSYGTDAYGGGVVLFGGTFEMSGGKICNNKAIPDSSGSGYGAGITMGSATFIMTGGEISGNNIISDGATVIGGAIKFEDTNAVFKIGGSAYIPYGVNGETGAGKNDIYVGENKKITIVSALTGTAPVATIVPASPSAGLTVLEKDTSVSAADFAAACGKIGVAPNGSDSYGLDSEGKLVVTGALVSSSSLENLTLEEGESYNLVLSSDFTSENLATLISNITNSSVSGVTLDLSNTSITQLNDPIVWIPSKVTSVTLPSNITTIAVQEFERATDLTEILLPGGENASFVVEDGILYNTDKTKLIHYPAAKSGDEYTLPSSVTTLGNEAFRNNKNLLRINGLERITHIAGDDVFALTQKLVEADLSGLSDSQLNGWAFSSSLVKKVILSSSITSLDRYCFSSCSQLNEIHFKNSSPPSLASNSIFTSCNSNVKFYVPKGSKSAYLNATGSSGFAGSNNPFASSLASRVFEEDPDVPNMLYVEGAYFDGSSAITGSAVFIADRELIIPDLYVSDHEVTQAEYQAVMGNNPSQFKTGVADGEVQGNRPVESISWYDAIAYCNKRSVAENLTPCYEINGITDWENFDSSDVPTSSNTDWDAATCDFDADGYRLPTEAEWECLARGGNRGIPSTQYTYAGSNELVDVGWYSANSGNMSHEVKKKTANSLGIYDMSGNVWEFCWDWFSDISDDTVATGVDSGSERILRGASWYDNSEACYIRNRDKYNPSNGNNSCIGFRVVRTK